MGKHFSGGVTMKIWVLGFAALGLAALAAPTRVQADTVQVNVTLTINGSATACSGPCTETLTGSFQWNTTTEAVVGTPTYTIAGPINYGTLTPLGTDTDLRGRFSDTGGDYLTVGFDLGSGTPVLGSYTAVGGSPSPGDFFLVGDGCGTMLCKTDFPASVVTISGASATVTLVSTPTPEPGTLGMLLVGFLGMTALGWYRTRLA